MMPVYELAGRYKRRQDLILREPSRQRSPSRARDPAEHQQRARLEPQHDGKQQVRSACAFVLQSTCDSLRELQRVQRLARQRFLA